MRNPHRQSFAAEERAGLVAVAAKSKKSSPRPKATVLIRGARLINLHGCGPVVAAGVRADVDDVTGRGPLARHAWSERDPGLGEVTTMPASETGRSSPIAITSSMCAFSHIEQAWSSQQFGLRHRMKDRWRVLVRRALAITVLAAPLILVGVVFAPAQAILRPEAINLPEAGRVEVSQTSLSNNGRYLVQRLVGPIINKQNPDEIRLFDIKKRRSWTVYASAGLSSQAMNPHVSPNGRFVTYSRQNRVSGASRYELVQRWDRKTRKTETLARRIGYAAVSSDGRFLAYWTKDYTAAYRIDIRTLDTELVVRASELNGGVSPIAVARDGSVALLVARGNYNNSYSEAEPCDLYTWRKSGTLKLASSVVAPTCAGPSRVFTPLEISADGRFTTFYTSSTYTVPSPYGAGSHYFRYDSHTGTTSPLTLPRPAGCTGPHDEGILSPEARFMLINNSGCREVGYLWEIGANQIVETSQKGTYLKSSTASGRYGLMLAKVPSKTTRGGDVLATWSR